MDAEDVRLANAAFTALKGLDKAIRAAEEHGLTVHFYAPEGDGSQAMDGARLSIGRDFVLPDTDD